MTSKTVRPTSFLSSSPPLSSKTERFWRYSLADSFKRPLDQVNVLGDDSYGHLSCVNALSWTPDGQALLSGGDDRTVRIWRIDPENDNVPYPFICTSVIQTGHRANIFNAHLLPHSTRIATVAGDKEVRVFEAAVAMAHSQSEPETTYSTGQLRPRILRCHTNRVKRIVTEDSPDLFLTVAEDGCVRQHDLRVPHSCGPGGSCPAPLVKCRHELSTLALSPLTPYQFVIAGESPYGYLFDRRHVGRVLEEEWGALPSMYGSDLATCVRRFGRKAKGPSESPHRCHITGARMSSFNGHEVLLSYSGDAVYLYSTHDDPYSDDDQREHTLLPPNHTQCPESIPILSDESQISGINPTAMRGTEEMDLSYPESFSDLRDDEDEDDYSLNNMINEEDNPDYRPSVPIVLPRRRFAGACNLETVKDVNFLGPEDEYVTSGSDEGNFFIWNKATGNLHGIYEGDGSIVNVIEGHPHLPLVAVSGIDSTVKLFSPVNGPSTYSRMDRAQNILEVNSRNSRRLITRGQIALIRAALAANDQGEGGPCNLQ